MKIVGGDAFIIYHTLYHYFKISPKIKIAWSAKKVKARWLISYLKLVCNVKTIRLKLTEKRHFTFTIYYTDYFKISKIRQIFKKSSIVKKSTSLVSNVIIDVCTQYENYPIKTVGEEAFYSYYISYHYFKISKIRQKFKNSTIVKRSTTQVSDIIFEACMQCQNYPI